MKAYIAGKLTNKQERIQLEKIKQICQDLGIETFLPHEDIGVIEFQSDIKKAFEGDIKALNECDIVLAYLDTNKIGTGTSWELGYGHAIGKPTLAFRTLPINQHVEELSAMLLGYLEFTNSWSKFKKRLKEFKSQSANLKA